MLADTLQQPPCNSHPATATLQQPPCNSQESGLGKGAQRSSAWAHLHFQPAPSTWNVLDNASGLADICWGAALEQAGRQAGRRTTTPAALLTPVGVLRWCRQAGRYITTPGPCSHLIGCCAGAGRQVGTQQRQGLAHTLLGAALEQAGRTAHNNARALLTPMGAALEQSHDLPPRQQLQLVCAAQHSSRAFLIPCTHRSW